MFTIPTLSLLYDQALADLQTEMGITLPVFGKLFLRPLAAVMAAKQKLYYLALGDIQKNIFVDTADSEANGGTLERFGVVKLNRRPFPARAGQYVITLTGTTGSVIAARTTWLSDDSSSNPGQLYILDADHTMAASSDTITVRATQAGIGSRLLVGDTLTATAPIAGVQRAAVVAAEAVEPLAAEDTEAYRAKAIQAYRLEPQGGAVTDYRLWSYDAQGVQQTYPYAHSGDSCQIDVYIEATVADSTDGRGTPTNTILAAVADAIELDPDTTKSIYDRGRRPLGVFMVNCKPITPLNVDITISGLGATTAEQNTIRTALRDAIAKIRPYVAGVDIQAERNDVLDINKITFIVQTARPGSAGFGTSMTIDSIPKLSYLFDGRYIPYLNSVTFV